MNGLTDNKRKTFTNLYSDTYIQQKLIA